MKDIVYVTGIHAVRNALENFPDRVIRVFWEDNGGKAHPRRAEVLELARENGLPCETRKSHFFRDRAKGRNAQGIAAQMMDFPYTDLHQMLSSESPLEMILICDGVTDPQNLGAMIRSAAFFGAKGVIIPRDKSALVTPLAERVSAGGTGSVPIVQVVNLSRSLDELKENGYWIYGTVEAGGEQPSTHRLKGKTAIVVGAEGQGIRRLTRDKCDVLLTLSAGGAIPALNVSVFAGLMMYEVHRQESA